MIVRSISPIYSILNFIKTPLEVFLNPAFTGIRLFNRIKSNFLINNELSQYRMDGTHLALCLL